jgi:hypothetical protein
VFEQLWKRVNTYERNGTATGTLANGGTIQLEVVDGSGINSSYADVN